MSTVIAEVRQALKQASHHLTTGVRINARKAGWPSSAARGLTVGDDYSVDMTDEAMDWEYGTLGRSPMPAVRRFAEDSNGYESKVLEEAYQNLKKRGVL